jgi:hemerythrin-like domain-containing protein
MKRDKSLQPLSRQHHNALMAVLLLKKGVQRKASEGVMRDFILYLWQNELKSHFAFEERGFAFLPNHYPEIQNYYMQMLNEHRGLETIIFKQLADEPAISSIIQFYTALEHHIRFEERIFFPMIESACTAVELHDLQHLFHSIDSSACIRFPIKFWE